MRKPATLVLLFGAAVASAQLPEVTPTVKVGFNLPVPVGSDLFQDITETLGQIDACAQLPLWKGLGVGAGYSGTWFYLEERALSPTVIRGDVMRSTWYGKLQYEHYAGPNGFYEFAFKAGGSTIKWDTENCPDVKRQNAFHWGLYASYYLHATDALAFGLTLGYEADPSAALTPDLLCLEDFTGRTTMEEPDPYRFFVLGLGFSTRLKWGRE